MASAQVAPVADNFKIGATAVAIALSLNPIGNGVGRVLWGWVSDHMGRERTMFTAFFLQVGVSAECGDCGAARGRLVRGCRWRLCS